MRNKNSTIIFMIFILFFSLPTFIFGQEKTITGTVISSDDDFPLTGASVLVKGTSIGTMTDFDGLYSINANEGDILEFSFMGFKTVEITVAGQTIIDVTLEEDTAMLDEIVITGYGRQRRAQLTTSVSKLDTQVLQTSTRSNVATALQGTIAGLRVTNTSGQPGSTPEIVLRGGTDFSDLDKSEPLILIDGIPGSFFGLNADDIESIEVLKDAAATAIYGARSSNGVILVTTKSGKSGRSSINYHYKFSSNHERNDQKYLGGEDHINYNRQGIVWQREVLGDPNAFSAFMDGANSMGTGNNLTGDPYTTQILSPANSHFLNLPGWRSIPDVTNPGQEILFYDATDIGGRIYQTSMSHDHYLAFDGGNEKGTYYLGLGLLDNEGLILGSNFKRYSGKFTGSYKITDKFKVNSNILYSHSNFNESPLGSDDTVFHRFQGQAPTSRTYDNNPDGSWTDRYAPGTNQSFGNPLYYQDKFVKTNLEQRLSTSVGIDWELMEDLTLVVTGSHFTVNNHKSSFDRAYRTGNNEGPINTVRKASVELERTMRNQVTGTLNYLKRFGDHNFNFLLGAEYFKDNKFETKAGTRNSPTDMIATLNVGPVADGIPYSFETEYVIVSNFGRVLYDFNDRYLVGFTYRYDGSSRLGNNKYGFFPGVSLGWNAHNETFFQESSIRNVISRLKPRLSYGVNGNQDVLGNYQVFGQYGQPLDGNNNPLPYVYGGQMGYVKTDLPTMDLKWEKSTTFNIGLDVSFFDDRVSIITDVYSRDVKDKLAKLILPYYTGYKEVLTNNGTYRNRGFELEINGDVIRNSDLTWNIGATLTSNKNYVVKLPENDNALNRQGGTLIWNPKTGQEEWAGGFQEGKRAGHDLVVAFQQGGIYASQTEADADNHITDTYMPNNSRNQRWAGDVKWVDQNNDGVIDELDRRIIGRTTPDFIGGITTSLNYKNFHLFVKTDFATGHMVWNHLDQKGYAQTQGNQALPTTVKNSWTPDNPNTDWPRFVFVNESKNVWRVDERPENLQHYGNERFWEKGDYLALREVTLSYDVPTDLFNGVIQRFSIYATGTNLHYFKKFSGDSPEVGGIQFGTFPMPRTFTLGLNVTF